MVSTGPNEVIEPVLEIPCIRRLHGIGVTETKHTGDLVFS